MTKELKVFKSEEFGSVRVVEINNEPWFVGKDVAEILGYKDTNRAVKQHVDKEDLKVCNRKGYGDLYPTLWNNENDFANKVLINESGIYSLVFNSELPNAKKFKKWVTSEVLPSIRQTGGYIHHDEEMSDEEIMARALQVAQRTIEKKNNKIKSLEKETLKLVDVIESQKPKLEYLDKILSCDDALLMTSIAFDYGLSAQALNKILCEERVQRNVRGQWILYSDYLGKGYTKTETKEFGGKPRVQTLWTQKGRMLIHEILAKRQVKAIMDLELAEA